MDENYINITIITAYFLIIFYLVIERLLRKGEKALSLKAGASDRGSTQIMLINRLFSIFLVLLAPILNVYQIGNCNSMYIGWVGLLLMLAGLSLRYWAAKTLGEFYTRTLQIIEGQRIFDQAPYSIIRHPGYLGVFLMDIGASLAVRNWVVLLAILTIAHIQQVRPQFE